MRPTLLAAFVALVAGCADPGVKWPDLYPAKGTVKVGGKTAASGTVQLRSEDPAAADYLVSGEVEADGSFTLSTSHAADKKGERRTGVPAGKYKVIYSPVIADQTAALQPQPVTLPTPVTISAGNNDIPIDVRK